MLLKVVVLFVSSCSLFAAELSDKPAIQKRIKPIGQVHIQPSKEAAAPVQETKIQAETINKGQTIYEQHCIVCHRDGLAGAPKVQNENDWKPRLIGRTLDNLVASSIKGLNAMPAKGTCTECSDADIKAAIDYMLPKS